jgi:alpha-N-arabinofuranosidase
MNSTYITMNPTQKKFDLNKDMYGVFFEEINHSGDGGLYAELIRNRNFCDAKLPEGTTYYNGSIRTATGHREDFSIEDPLPAWQARTTGQTSFQMEPWFDEPRNPAVPNQLKLTVSNVDEGTIELVNNGYWGMSVDNDDYCLTIISKSPNIQCLKVSIQTPNGEKLAETTINGIEKDFQKQTVYLTPLFHANKCILVLSPCENGEIYFDYVSLFPVHTFKDRENGMNTRIASMIAALKPGFMRFPGGCIVEGISMENAFTFKRTIGAVEDRTGCWNLWGYRRTDGIGYHEYLQFCEDIGARAMYVCNCGMSCQGRSSQLANSETIQYFLQDAIDAIDYAMAPITNKWGALRAKNGHIDPFELRYIEIGNENWGADYEKRYDIFYRTLKERYPNLLYIINDSARKEQEPFDFDLVDEHYYVTPSMFPAMEKKYDHYNRNNYKVYVGEYAANQDVGLGNMAAAAAEASFMINMERNGDVVTMASYAPLLCHVQNRIWPVNLICYEDDVVYGIPSYYVQKLFNCQKAKTIVDTVVKTTSFSDEAKVHAIGGLDDNGQIILKAVNFSCESTMAHIDVPYGYALTEIFEIAAETPESENTIQYPTNVAIKNIRAESNLLLKPYGVYVFCFNELVR